MKTYYIDRSTQKILNQFNGYKAYEVLLNKHPSFNPKGYMDWLLGEWIILVDKRLDITRERPKILSPYICSKPENISIIKENWPFKTNEGKLILPTFVNKFDIESMSPIFDDFKNILEKNNIRHNFIDKYWYLYIFRNVIIKDKVRLKINNNSNNFIKTIKKIKI
jgi:hypothetical protein